MTTAVRVCSSRSWRRPPFVLNRWAGSVRAAVVSAVEPEALFSTEPGRVRRLSRPAAKRAYLWVGLFDFFPFFQLLSRLRTTRSRTAVYQCAFWSRRSRLMNNVSPSLLVAEARPRTHNKWSHHNYSNKWLMLPADRTAKNISWTKPRERSQECSVIISTSNFGRPSNTRTSTRLSSPPSHPPPSRPALVLANILRISS